MAGSQNISYQQVINNNSLATAKVHYNLQDEQHTTKTNQQQPTTTKTRDRSIYRISELQQRVLTNVGNPIYCIALYAGGPMSSVWSSRKEEIKMKTLYEETKARLLEAKAKGLLNVHPIVLVVKSGQGDVPLKYCHRDKDIPARL